MRILLSMLALVLGIGTAQAATLTTSGATGVDVNGTLYDVEFVDGTCNVLFSGCDDPSDFAFTTETDATDASNALLALIGITPTIDLDPRVDGCTRTSVCFILTPYALPVFGLLVSGLVNSSLPFQDSVYGAGLLSPSWDSSSDPTATYARWTVASVATVPLPASALLLLGGLAGLIATGGRKRKHA